MSCADKRWNENFTTFLQNHDLKYVIENGVEKCYVNNMPLDVFLERNESKHEFIRKNILTATLNFNHRVQEFIKTIIMNEYGEMCVNYYNYRVEFQMRGAGHIHGTLWLDWIKMKKNMEEEKEEGNKEYIDVDSVQNAFTKIKDEIFGGEDRDEDEFNMEQNALAAFIDKFCTCSLKDLSTRDIVRSVNMHNHTKSCRKIMIECRFRFPRFPSLRTIIAIPAEIRYKDPEKASKALNQANALLKRVKDVLEDDDLMAFYCKYYQDEIEVYIKERHIVKKLNEIIAATDVGVDLLWKDLDEIIKNEYDKYFVNDDKDMDKLTLENLKVLHGIHAQRLDEIDIKEYLKERLDLVLKKAKVYGESIDERINEYEKALSITPKRYSVVAKRDIDEIKVNFYNPEWILCWDGNMDIQPCLDFFGIITYITDYYMKDDSGTLKFIKEVLDKAGDAPIKTKLSLVKQTFLTHRQIGESEAYYKLFPHLHLAHSNISAIFLPTGFKKNRSRFLKQITQEQANCCENVIEVEDKEGKFYIEKETTMDKWLGIPKLLKKLTYSQFGKRYTITKTVPKKYKFEDDFNESKLTQADIDNENYIFTDKEPRLKERKRKLPKYIPTEGINGLQWMMLRCPYALRLHKFKKKENAHEYYFSEMQLYLPFKTEESLFPEDFDKCLKKYKKNESKINAVKGKVMKHLAQVQEMREHAENIIANEIGDELDANKEQIENDDVLEGIHEHPELFIKDPTGLLNNLEMDGKSNNVYRKIDLQIEDDINKKIKMLDVDQRLVVDIGVDYAKKLTRPVKPQFQRPVAPLVIVHGGAGTGKSTVIDALSQSMEKIFRTPGDDPNHPYIIKAAFTGNAAFIVQGQTLHSAFNFPYGNQFFSLSDKVRDNRRTLLKNLRAVIIDEMSLVKSDMLYQLHFRLMKDIFQNELDFGGVAVFVLGDILQIEPVKGKSIYSAPHDPRLKLCHAIDDLWKKFSVINLKTNHRQGEDKVYADLLNRVRIGQHTEEDLAKLRTRVFKKDDAAIPTNALYISGTNLEVNRINDMRLSKLEGTEQVFVASVFSDTKGYFKPNIDKKGDVNGTTLPYKLCLKHNCRVMLTYNLDVCDSLTNGSQGFVIDFEFSKDGSIRYILVKFDERESGRERRKSFNFDNKYPGQNVTPIEMKETSFSLSKHKTNASSTATALQFPLKLAFAATAHKIQGHTVKTPQSLIVDLQTWIRPAMAYVMLSRIQTISQLYIIGSVPENDIKPWPSALEELERLNRIAINNPINQDKRFKIISLNTYSLRKHISDVKGDYQLLAGNIICLQETWLEPYEESQEIYQIPNFNSHFNSQGRGKGLATFFPDVFTVEESVGDPQYQISMIVSSKMSIINVYRSEKASDNFLKELEKLLKFDKTIIVCGDFNYCHSSQVHHPVHTFFTERNFIQLVSEATHKEGRLLDHSYVYYVEPFSLNDFDAKTHGCYYSDHDKVVTLINSELV